ncbi:MAG: hypothetical protein H8F28_27720 [Fibrella sp.]|nr:hypothetical protein [Armatimonadota bacterium]
MRIRWTKTDGQGKPDTLACFRDDGTTSYTRLSAFFPLHDLMHYAVETTLGYENAFWGLIARGWDFDSFAEKDTQTGKIARTLPSEALVAENLVGFLQLAQTGSVSSVPDALYRFLMTQWDPVPVEITPDRLAVIQSRFAELLEQWQELPHGGALELFFPAYSSGRGV